MIGNKTIQINGTSIDLTQPFAERLMHIAEGYAEINKLIAFLQEWCDNREYIIQNTSGSTGTPKPVTLKKKAMLASARLTCTHFNLTPSSTLLLCLDPDYIAGKMMIVRAIFSQSNLILRSPNNIHKHYPTTKIDFVAMVPFQLETLINKDINLKNTSSILLGGAPISTAQEEHFNELLPAIWHSYAMTETCSHVALRQVNGSSASPLYKALPDVHFSLSDKSTLIIEAPALLEKPITTNDVVELKNAETFSWIGRSDFIINSGGVKVSPEKVEKLISDQISIPYYISSKKAELLGDEVCLVLESATPLSPDEELELLQKLKAMLPKYHAPRSIIYVDKLPQTANGKLKRERF